jgi:hypothetical protein
MSDTYMMAEEYDSESMALDAADAIGEVFTSAIVSEVYSARHGRQDTTFYVDTPGGKRFTFTVTESTDIQA